MPRAMELADCMGDGWGRNFLPLTLKSELSPVNARCVTLMFYSVARWLAVFSSVDIYTGS